MSPKRRFVRMGKRGNNHFLKNDAIRALQSARDGGLEPAAMEVILGRDGGVTIRILGDKAVAHDTSHGTANPWDAVLKGDGDHAPKQKRSA
jgi:hypothetical protein